jgi:hypothetical protein
MEDVLDVHHRPYDPEHPVVCMDEASEQLIVEVRPPLPAQPSRTAKYDSEYEQDRNTHKSKIDWRFYDG